MEPENKPSNDRSTRVLLAIIVIAIIGFLVAIYWLDHRNTGRNSEINTSTGKQAQTSASPTPDFTNIVFPIPIENNAVVDAGLYYILEGRIQDIELIDPQKGTYEFTLLSPEGAMLNQKFSFSANPDNGTKITKVSSDNVLNQTPASVSDLKQGTQIQFSFNIDFKRNPAGSVANIIIHQP